eukprot:507859-Pelagomonas_calceolata.AAC.1
MDEKAMPWDCLQSDAAMAGGAGMMSWNTRMEQPCLGLQEWNSRYSLNFALESRMVGPYLGVQECCIWSKQQSRCCSISEPHLI